MRRGDFAKAIQLADTHPEVFWHMYYVCLNIFCYAETYSKSRAVDGIVDIENDNLDREGFGVQAAVDGGVRQREADQGRCQEYFGTVALWDDY